MANFEEQLTQLETVVDRLERGDLSLDESVRLFEDGMKLSHACKGELEQAEGRVQVLVEGRDGNLHPEDVQLGETESDDADATEQDDAELK